ncbi:hypothetical protein SAMN05444671_3751 [Flavobacterium sp. CF108]|nr:hypothetical protein [Flavobacterium sp. CF108]SEO55076.1 hypothetical protein SAMN04487978_3184 [Flavobacterium sp. fv08]SHH75801.1 hypothetical protein SAMN05444671_3751 [Flavobacterium sp. CF108]
MKQNILVTGASSGFGLLIANDLHRKGLPVLITLQHFAYGFLEKTILKQ